MRGKVAGMAEMTLEGVDARPEDSAFTLGRVHSIETMGTVDGPGIRFVVFVQGCPMRCAYCHNPDTWSVNGGTMVTVEHLMDEFQSNHEFYRSGGITVSGGEPLLQPEFLADLFRAMHNNPDGRVHTCLDSCGYAFDPTHPEKLDTVLNETFADTASRDYLIMRCAERGITPLPATCAVGIGEFSMDIPIGTRFSCDKYNWTVTEKIESLKYYLTCETAGADPNGYTGQFIPIEYIEGLATAELTSIVINGEDEEATETLRLRYLNSFENQSYGFNRGQYIEVTEALPGVGGCKPYRAWKGPGTVKLVITGSDYQPPSDTLINTVQTAIDPTQNSGDGIGLAPIDHEVTVVGAAGTTVNISTTLTFASGWNLTECLPYIQSALDAYYLELNSTWSKEAGLIVRVSQIESRLLALAGIVDISGTTLNGQAGNLTLDKDAVAVRGSFTNA